MSNNTEFTVMYDAYIDLIKSIVQQTVMFTDIPTIDAIEAQMIRNEELAPFIDPTGYIKNRAKIEAGRKIVQIFARFRRELDTIKYGLVDE